MTRTQYLMLGAMVVVSPHLLPGVAAVLAALFIVLGLWLGDGDR